VGQEIPRFAYEPEVKITTSQKEYSFRDVNNYAIYRTPFIKTSSFASITVILDMTVYQYIDDDIRRNNYPTLEIKMNLAANENSERVNERTFKSRSGGTSNIYKILMAQPREAMVTGAHLIPVTCFLANSALYELTQNKSYNKLIANKTALDVLNDYENHLTTNYGNSFGFKKFLGDDNFFTYKQLLIKTENDMMVPQWIVNNSKPSNGLTYYFFDDFIPLPGYNSINGLLITLSKSNIQNFELIDITEPQYADMGLKLVLTNQKSISDMGGILLAQNPTLVIADKANKVVCIKGSSIAINGLNQNGSQSDSLMGRSLENREMAKTSTNINSHGINLYACDTVGNAKQRFDNISNLVRNDIEYLATYEMLEVHFDIVQLFRSYILTPETDIKYVSVPISIVNVFSKYSKRETTMRHGVRFQSLVYKF
jgi:hypothetical protein